MEPITGILAAVSAANAAFGAVKKLVATGREIQDVAGQIGKWYGAFGDFNRLATEKANKKPSIFKRLLHDGSVEHDAQAGAGQARVRTEDSDHRSLR
jgi:hypothetical protein